MAAKRNRCTLQDGEVINGLYRVIRFIGRGAAGEVYEVEQLSLGVRRALKLLSPQKRTSVSIEQIKSTFPQEILNTLSLAHTNIIKLLDYGVYSATGKPGKPFYVAELAKPDLKEAIKRVNDCSTLLNIIDQLLEALHYIHEREMLHGDIKPSNILYVHPLGTEDIEVKIADLGVSKIMRRRDHIDVSATSGMTYVYGSVSYAAPEILEHLNNGDKVSEDWLKERRRVIDLYAFGVSLAELVSNGSRNQRQSHKDAIPDLLKKMLPNLVNCLNEAEIKYIRRFILKLTEFQAQDRYQSAEEARLALRRITAKDTAFVIIPELTGVGCTHELVYGGGMSRFSPKSMTWINHPVFQRLHNLNQLAFLYNVYPDARHSRFSHSLRVFEAARRVVLNLLDDAVFRFYVSETDISHFLAAALLHDIGHYPLAHLVDELAVGDDGIPSIKTDSEMVQYFLQLDEFDGKEPLHTLLRRSGIDPDTIVKLVSPANEDADEPLTSAQLLLKSLIDGPLDIDKIAYLKQDSEMTSVNYGQGIDLEGFFISLVVLEPERDELPLRIGIKDRGISAAESILTARYHMYERVYWHRTNRSIMAMLSYALRILFEGSQAITFDDYLRAVRSRSDWEAIHWVSECLETRIRNQEYREVSGRRLRNILPGISDGSRQLHKRFLTFSTSLNQDQATRGIHEFLLQTATAKRLEAIRQEILSEIAKKVNGRELFDDEVLIDIPRKRIAKDGNPIEFAVLNERTGKLTTLLGVSKIASAVAEQYNNVANRTRIFVSPQLATEISGDDVLKQHITRLLKRASQK